MWLNNLKYKALILSLLITAQTVLLRAQWVQKSNFPWQEFINGSVFSIGTTIYVMPGAHPVNGNSFWAYNTLTDAWSQRAAFPGSVRESGIAFSAGGKGYFGMGAALTATTPQTAVFYNDLWEYNPVSDTWNAKASLPASGREGAVAFELNGFGYVGTGFGGVAGNLADFWEYDPATNNWQQKAFFPGSPRTMASGVGINGKGFVGMGANYNQSSIYSDFYMYLPSSNTWSTLASFNGGGTYSSKLVFAGNILYLTGGFLLPQSSNISQYDPVSNSWASLPAFPGGFRTNHIAINAGGRIFMGTGADQGNFYKKDWWEFNPLGLSSSQEKEVSNKIPHVFPNPAQKGNSVHFHNCSNTTLTFYDLYGKMPYSIHLKNDSSFILPPHLSPGIYTLLFEGPETSLNAKFMLTE